MGAILAIALAVLPAPALAGSAFAGMGGVGVGIADPSGELSENPATAAAAGVDRSAGLVHLGGGGARMTFAGRVYNSGGNTTGSFASAWGLGWSAVSPVVNEGRVGVGVWQVDRHDFELDESLDISISGAPGSPPLSNDYARGRTRVVQGDALHAVGGVWIQPLADGNQQVAAGVLYLNQTGRGRLAVHGERADTGNDAVLRVMNSRRSLNGFGAVAGYFYRPLPDGSLGLSLTYLGPLEGRIWEQDEGGPLLSDDARRPAQFRVSAGGAFRIAKWFTVAVDMRYAGEVRGSSTLFAGTPAARIVEEFSDATFAIHAGAEYRLPLFFGDMPVRMGYFNRPDPLPAATSGAGASSLAGFRLPSVKQDVTGFTIGTGYTRSSVSVDAALMYLLVNTHTKLMLPGGIRPVDSGDVRSSYGAVASMTIRFGPKAGE